MRSETRTVRMLPAAIAAVALLAGAGAADDKPAAVVPAAEARDHVDKSCTVEMTVRSSKNAAPRREYYLDSEEDFHDEKNFAVVISLRPRRAVQEGGHRRPGRALQGQEAAGHGEGDPRERPDPDPGRGPEADQVVVEDDEVSPRPALRRLRRFLPMKVRSPPAAASR